MWVLFAVLQHSTYNSSSKLLPVPSGCQHDRCVWVCTKVYQWDNSQSKHLWMNDSFAAVYFTHKFQITPSRILRIFPASNNIWQHLLNGGNKIERISVTLNGCSYLLQGLSKQMYFYKKQQPNKQAWRVLMVHTGNSFLVNINHS